MHLAICIFGADTVMEYKMISMLAGDNLRCLIQKCQGLIKEPTFAQAVCRASGQDNDVVQKAFTGSFDSPTHIMDTLKALSQVYMGLMEKFPTREYERVNEKGFLEEPACDEEGFQF